MSTFSDLSKRSLVLIPPFPEYPPKIPCHRVIRTDGSLGGYSGKGGIKTKLRLLKSEKVDI